MGQGVFRTGAGERGFPEKTTHPLPPTVNKRKLKRCQRARQIGTTSDRDAGDGRCHALRPAHRDSAFGQRCPDPRAEHTHHALCAVLMAEEASSRAAGRLTHVLAQLDQAPGPGPPAGEHRARQSCVRTPCCHTEWPGSAARAVPGRSRGSGGGASPSRVPRERSGKNPEGTAEAWAPEREAPAGWPFLKAAPSSRDSRACRKGGASQAEGWAFPETHCLGPQRPGSRPTPTSTARGWAWHAAQKGAGSRDFVDASPRVSWGQAEQA